MIQPKQELYNKLKADGKYTKSYQDFEKQFSTPEAQSSLYSALNNDGLYTKSKEDFYNQFFAAPVKKKEVSDSASPSQKSASVPAGGSSGTQKLRLPNENDFAEMQRRGQAPPPSVIKSMRSEPGAEYNMDASGNPLPNEFDGVFSGGYDPDSIIKVGDRPNQKQPAPGKNLRLPKDYSGKPKEADDTKLYDDFDQIKKDIDTQIEDNDLNLDHPYLYYSTYGKSASGPNGPIPLSRDEFVNTNFGDSKLESIGINPADFDGFLNRNGYKQDYNDKDQRGLFGDGNRSRGDLGREMEKQRLLSLYMEDINGRRFTKDKLEAKKLNLDRNYEERIVPEPVTLFDPDQLKGYMEEEMPLLSQKLKEVDAENKKILDDHKKGNNGFWYGTKQTLKAGWNGIVDRINSLAATGYDKIGLKTQAGDVRMLHEQNQLDKPNLRDVAYVSGKRVNYDGTDYIVDKQGQIYDADLKIRVTDTFDKSQADAIKKKEGEEDWIFSPQGGAIQTGGVLGDLLVQVALTRGVGGATGAATRAIGGTTAAALNEINISRSLGSAILTQTAMGYSSGLEDTLRAAKDAGINEKEAQMLAADASQRMALLYAVTAPISPQTKAMQALFGAEGKSLIKKAISAYSTEGRKGFVNTMESGIAELAKKAGGFTEEGLKELFQENIQQTGETGFANAATNDAAGQKLLKETMTGDDFVNTSILSFMAGGLASQMKLPSLYRSAATERLRTLQSLANDNSRFESNLNQMVTDNVIPRDIAEKLREDVRVYASQSGKVPNNLSPDIALPVMHDLDAISKLQAEKKNIDKSFHPDIDEKINAKRADIASKLEFSKLPSKEKQSLLDKAETELKDGKEDKQVSPDQILAKAISNYKETQDGNDINVATTESNDSQINEPAETADSQETTPQNTEAGQISPELQAIIDKLDAIREKAMANGMPEEAANRNALSSLSEEEYALLMNRQNRTVNESTPGENTAADGNVQPGTAGMGENGGVGTGTSENVQPGTDAGSSEGTVEIAPTADRNANSPARTGETIKRITSGNADFDITYNAEGGISKIRSAKDGREIPKFTERVNKKTGKKTIVKNSNYSRIESEALGTQTENQLNKERKQRIQDALDNFTPNDPYTAALDYLARGGNVSLESSRRETGLSDSELRWATGFKPDSTLPSIEMASEIITEGTDIDQMAVRDSLIELLQSKSGRNQIEDEIVSLQGEANAAQQQAELEAYRNSLSDEQAAMFDALLAEDEYISELTDQEAEEYYQQIADEYEQGRAATGEQANGPERTDPAEGNDGQGQSESQQGGQPESGTGSDSKQETSAGPGESTGTNTEEQSGPDGEAPVNTMGIAGSGDNIRDLTGRGKPVRDLLRYNRKFRKLWAQTFSSNAGADSNVAETVRSRNRDIAAFTDALNHEATVFKKLLKAVEKANPKEFLKRSRAINDYLAGQDADVSFLNESQKQQLDYFRQRIDALSDAVISKLENTVADSEARMETAKEPSRTSIQESIDRTNALIETIKANKGQYLNRSYQIFSDDNYAQVLTLRKEEMNKESRERIDNAVDYLVNEEGYTREEAESYIADYLDAIKRAGNDFNLSANGKANAPFLKKRKDLPEAFRELLGESRDPLFNYINTVYKISGYIANLEYQDRMRATLLDSGIGSTTAKQGYTKLTADGEGWNALSDIYVPNEVKEAIDAMAPLQQVNSSVYRAWIKFAGFTKLGKTIASPTTISRNLISGIDLGFSGGHFFLFDPKATAEAWNQALGTNKSQTELRNARQKLIRLGVLGDGANSGEINGILNDFSKETERMIKTNKFEWSLDLMKKIYAFGDDFYKVAGFYIEKGRFMDAGMNEQEAEVKAADRIRNGYPTYSYLPKNFQRLRRVPIVGTFISFPYEKVRTTFNNMGFIKEDWEAGRKKMAAQRAAGLVLSLSWASALSAMTAAMIGFDDEDDDALRDMLPEYQRNSQLIYTGTKNSRPTFIDGTALATSEVLMKPISTLFEQREGREFEDKLLEAGKEFLAPYLGQDISFKTAMNLANNTDEFGNQIYKGKSFGEGVLKDSGNIINYYLKQAGPGVYNNFSEFMRANEIAPEFFGDKFTAYGKEYTNEEALLALAGFRSSTINYNTAITSFGYRVKDEYAFDRKTATDALKTSKKLSEKDIERIATRYKEANDVIIGRLEGIVNAGRKLGMDDREISAAIKRAGFSSQDARAIVNGKGLPLKPVSDQSSGRYEEKIDVNYDDKERSTELRGAYRANLRAFEREVRRINTEYRKNR